MLDMGDVTLLLAVAAVALAHNLLYLRPRLRRHAGEAKKYRLFAVRDELIRLVAEGKAREEDFAVQKLYKLVNFLVTRPDRLNLSTFVMSLQLAKQKGLSVDPDDERIMGEIRRNRDLSRVMANLYDALMSIIWDNSATLRILVRCRKLLPKKKDGPSSLPPVPPVQREAYEIYKSYRRASQRLAAVA